jgi:hypothetical protein
VTSVGLRADVGSRVAPPARLAVRSPTALSFKHSTLLSDPSCTSVQDPRGPALSTVCADKRNIGLFEVIL